nr:cysteine-rich RLK (receptor-like protein kinase) 8 [Tanacetum cinerariifolium]
MILISKKLTSSEFYTIWKRSMMIELSARNKLDGHMINQLNNEIVHLKQMNCSVEVYYHKLKGLWDELDALEAPYNCTCKWVCENGKTNGERDLRERLIQFLMGLDESYTNIRGQILLLQPLPIVAKAYNMLRHEEKQREVPKQTTLAVPFALNTYTPNTPYVAARNNMSQNTRTQPRRSTFRSGVICGNCNKEGHTKEEC